MWNKDDKMGRMDKIWKYLEDHNPCPEEGLFGWFLIIFGVLLGFFILAPWIGIALGLIVTPFVMLRMLYHIYPHIVMTVVMIMATIAVIWLTRSYNRYKREKKERYDHQEAKIHPRQMDNDK